MTQKKINVAELLKDCPVGMELDCMMFDAKVIYQGLNKKIPTHPIVIQTEHGFEVELTQYGQIHNIVGSKCVIFPKGKTTWEGFHRPFKDGDIIYTKHKLGTEFVSIFQIEYERDICTYWDINLSTNKLIGSLHDGNAFKVFIEKDKVKEQRLATETEKEKLFQAIKDHGYNWNAKTKRLAMLVEPKFKVGDRIKLNNSRFIYTITDLLKDRYRTTINSSDLYEIEFERQDEYELVLDKFDISTLKPFNTRVLVRSADGDLWKPAIYGFSHSKGHYVVGGVHWRQCIPHEGNEHLLGQRDDCDDFYKNW